MALRLKHARWMLENTALSAARIASELGFSDSSHFCRSFKARYGQTPSDLRQSAGPGRRNPRSRPGGSRGGDNADRRVFE
jgi:transcriptional regulator GlxA family with amidase domain